MATKLSNHPSRFRTAVAGRQPVYMDYAATTPVDERVAEKMMECLTLNGVFANPASTSHQMGRDAKGLVELARVQVANLVNAKPTEIIWTSGATESDNLAIKGAAHLGAHKNRRHIITCKTEHKAVLDTCKQLELEGFQVTYMVPEKAARSRWSRSKTRCGMTRHWYLSCMSIMKLAWFRTLRQSAIFAARKA